MSQNISLIVTLMVIGAVDVVLTLTVILTPPVLLHQERVYYLAADSESDMVRWVTCLCRLCDLNVGSIDNGMYIEIHREPWFNRIQV